MTAICPNPYRDLNLELTRKICEIIAACKEEYVVCPVFSSGESTGIPGDIAVTSLEECIDDINYAIVVGGDGTILAVAKQVYNRNIPILGINLGTMGFMASVEPEDIGMVSQLYTGDYSISSRMMLDVSLTRDGEVIYSGAALNDAVIHGYGDCVLLMASCGRDKIASLYGDGIIIASPTGSTGYSMSAGGPILEPDTNNILVTPICPHALGSRAFVLDPSRTVYVTAERLHDRKAFLSIDGENVSNIINDDLLTVKRSEHSANMIDFGTKSFFETAYEKLI